MNLSMCFLYLYKILKIQSNNKVTLISTSIINKLEKVNKQIENIINAIMNGIVNNMLKDKLDE